MTFPFRWPAKRRLDENRKARVFRRAFVSFCAYASSAWTRDRAREIPVFLVVVFSAREANIAELE